MADYSLEEFERHIAKVVSDESLARKLITLHGKYEFIIGILYTEEISDFFEDENDFKDFIEKHELERARGTRFFDDYQLGMIFQKELNVSEKVLDNFFECEAAYLVELGWMQPG